MVLERLLKKLEYIGEGSYSRVYGYRNNFVLKLPFDSYACEILPIRNRIRQAKCIVGWTSFLRSHLGDVITETSYHVGGAVMQRRLSTLEWDKVDYYARKSNVRVTTDELIEKARKLIKSMNVDDMLVDGNFANFRFNEDGSVSDWFDPIRPPDDLFTRSDLT